MKVFVTSCVYLPPLISFLQLQSYNNVFAQKIPLKLRDIKSKRKIFKSGKIVKTEVTGA